MGAFIEDNAQGGRGLTYAQGPHVTYDRRTEKQTNAEHSLT